MAWFKRFVDPIILPDRRKLLTLRDAAEYITALPKAEHDAADWQVAMETLILVAERGGPEMLARIAVMKALNRHGVQATPAPRRKPAKVFGLFGDPAASRPGDDHCQRHHRRNDRQKNRCLEIRHLPHGAASRFHPWPLPAPPPNWSAPLTH
ncbi:hypothetical protein ACFIOY_40190 [Bradyrhizobium sp. TZ2]